MIRVIQIVILGSAVACLVSCSSAETAQPAVPRAFPPVPVSVGQAEEDMVPIEVKGFGTVEAFASVDVKSQVAGPLLSVKFSEGSNVTKGELLFEIDPRPFQEALRQAEAALTKDTSQLKWAEANLARDQANQKNANSDAARYAQLARAGLATRMPR